MRACDSLVKRYGDLKKKLTGSRSCLFQSWGPNVWTCSWAHQDVTNLPRNNHANVSVEYATSLVGISSKQIIHR